MATPLSNVKPPRLSRARVRTVLFLIYSAILVVEFEYRYLDDLCPNTIASQRSFSFTVVP